MAAVVRAANKYGSLLDGIADTPDRLDALRESNVIEQVAAAAHTTTVQYVWESGQNLSVHGLILDRHNRFIEGFHLSVNEIDFPVAEHTASIVDLAKPWNIHPEI